MKKVLSLAAAGLLAAGAAQAGSLTVANSDIVLYGGVSASYDWQDNDLAALSNANDKFRVSTFAIGLMKKAGANSPIGFNAAFASFQVPTVLASPDVVNDTDPGTPGNQTALSYGATTDFKPWLAYVTIAPVEGLSVDAGLLWSKYGEAPLTILNPHYARGALFVLFNPVLFAGARVNYDAGIAKVYAGYNQGGGLFQSNVKDAVEAGAMADLGMAKAGIHIYDEAAGRNIYTLCAKTDLEMATVGIQLSYLKEDDALQDNTTDDDMYGVALKISPKLANNMSVPIRIEYVNTDAKDDDTIWTFTITPTYRPTANTFVRVEAAYTTADAKMFVDVDDPTSTKDNRTTLAFEAGFLF
ncbi:MAG: outer membrane beta-barrel protein [Aquificae bacterium]|nr:outer membrane beta-barrel protein [Aquificota bacterium]